ncbi:MAG: hypothetical protein A3F84_03840 [Candidatus Handelsmanbacteria bacterium RIFCSPLOWO2_12_FULL_64_10]|uniref:Uncharacterized protein n=1 Tax=Handelsmanbacteria sp. (strain RIFCSPLOWO2_12_FULL_64_10) TaxID=1817868 RepID=A0A1F6CSS5_HANXR|nr:MAG: hypothetical protein A3F84_03840 [Candidatus Handelsmanbacteria bacterium RIFCSPLOWO2_12_FULL_64_10]
MYDILYILALFVALALPALLALKWGDRIAEAWDRRRLRRQRRRRIPLPRALPGQDELLTGLRAAEERSETLDLQISERLLDLQRLTVDAYRQRRSGSATDLLKPAEALEALTVKKEDRLNLLLDLACLQSDRIDAMTAEVEALSQVAGWGAAPPRTDQEKAPVLPAPTQEPPPSAADQLLKKIEEASRKRRSIDERLKQMKSWRPPGRTPPRSQPPPDLDAGQKGSRFDTTIQ